MSKQELNQQCLDMYQMLHLQNLAMPSGRQPDGWKALKESMTKWTPAMRSKTSVKLQDKLRERNIKAGLPVAPKPVAAGAPKAVPAKKAASKADEIDLEKASDGEDDDEEDDDEEADEEDDEVAAAPAPSGEEPKAAASPSASPAAFPAAAPAATPAASPASAAKFFGAGRRTPK